MRNSMAIFNHIDQIIDRVKISDPNSAWNLDKKKKTILSLLTTFLGKFEKRKQNSQSQTFLHRCLSTQLKFLTYIDTLCTTVC